MATKVTAQTATVTITETITLNGVARSGKTTVDIPSVGEVKSGIMSVTDSSTGSLVMTIGATASFTGTLTSIKYIRLTNLDDENFISIRIRGAADTFGTKIDAGKSIVWSNLSMNAIAGSDFDIAPMVSGFEDLAEISALADTAACDLEYYILST